MIVVFPKNSFSNLIDKDKKIERDFPSIALSRKKELDKAERIIGNNKNITSLNDMYKLKNEDLSILVSDGKDLDLSYYLKYNEKSAITIVVDPEIREVLQIVIDPNLVKKYSTSHMEAYGNKMELLYDFIKELKKAPSIEEMINEQTEDEVFFIDMEESKGRYEIEVFKKFIDFLNLLNSDVKGAIFIKKDFYHSLICKSDGYITDISKITNEFDKKCTTKKEIMEAIKENRVIYSFCNNSVTYIVDVVGYKKIENTDREIIKIVLSLINNLLLP